MPKAWKHQREALDFIRNRPGAMLDMDMGTGKSKVIIDLIYEQSYQSVLILAPLSVVDHVWPGQFKTHARDEIHVISLGSQVPGVKAKLDRAQKALKRVRPSVPTVIVLNYESCWRKPMADWLPRQRLQLLALDESHRIKSPDGTASLWISRLANQVPQRIALSGTPMANSPLDIFAQFRALDKRIFGNSYLKFKTTYAVTRDITIENRTSPSSVRLHKVKKIIDYQNLDDLNRKFRSIAYGVRAEDALDLPPVLRTYPRVTIGAKAKKVYEELERDLHADLEQGRVVTAANALARLLRLQQVTSGFAPASDGQIVQVDDAKARALTDTLDAIPTGEPVVVFARFSRDLQVIAERAKDLGRPCFELSGQKKELEEWKAQGGVLAVQIQAGGMGVDMTQARYAVYYSIGFSLSEYQQSAARLHRPGQTRPVQYIHLTGAGTVDETVIRALGRKENIIEKVLQAKSLQI